MSLNLIINRPLLAALITAACTEANASHTDAGFMAFSKLMNAAHELDKHLAGMEPKITGGCVGAGLSCSAAAGCASCATCGQPAEAVMPEPEPSNPVGESFYLVWNEANGIAAGSPTHKHGDHTSAIKEAERLARKYPGDSMFVLRASSKHVAQPRPVEQTDLVDVVNVVPF